MNFFVFVLDTQYFVNFLKVLVREVLVAFISIVRKYDKSSLCLRIVSERPRKVTREEQPTRQCAHALVLYSARSRNAHM